MEQVPSGTQLAKEGQVWSVESAEDGIQAFTHVAVMILEMAWCVSRLRQNDITSQVQVVCDQGSKVELCVDPVLVALTSDIKSRASKWQSMSRVYAASGVSSSAALDVTDLSELAGAVRTSWVPKYKRDLDSS